MLTPSVEIRHYAAHRCQRTKVDRLKRIHEGLKPEWRFD